MRTDNIKAILNSAARVIGLLLFGAVAAFGQQQINLTAGPANATLPDGRVVPMWGYSCDATQVSGSTATCAALNAPAAAAGGWSPVVITVPTGQDLTISLTNHLSFTGAGVPTSIVIVGQLGGGLGTVGTGCTAGTTCTSSPDHSGAQGAATWPIAGAPNSSGVLPPGQGMRVQSFATEVAAGTTTSTPLCWGVTCATPTLALRPGTYLIESGTHPSIQGPMGLYGILVVTTAPSGATAGLAYGTTGTPNAVNYAAEVPLLFSEIDPVQNNAVSTAVNTAGFKETNVWSGQPGQCGNPSAPVGVVNTCYPPAVNYTPLYYLINGSAFTKTNASASLFAATAGVTVDTTTGLLVPVTTGITGSVLVRMVNAGLRMHVPSIVGSQTTGQTGAATPTVTGFELIAEDGNVLPGVFRVQSEVFMPAGKTYDVMFNAPGAATLPVYDRELSLSSNATARDGGMLAYISVNGASLPSTGVFASTATANADTYNSVIAGQTLTVSDPAKGVLANDINVYGAKVVGTAPAGLTLNTDGTFTYTAGTPTTFTYCGNGTTTGPACALVTLGAANKEAATGITCTVPTPTYTSNVATTLSIKPPGVLSFCKDAAGYPLTVNGATSTTPLTVTMSGGGNVSIDLNGGFNATTTTGTHTFSFTPANSQGTAASSSATVTLVFPAPSNLLVNVVDGQDKVTPITDYRWIIEEDRTFQVDPNNTATGTATTSTTLDCTTNPATCAVPLTFGTNFHTSYMPLIAAGCTGTLSCEGGQTVLGVPAVCDVGNGVCRTTDTQQTILKPSQVYLDPTKHYYISVLSGDAGNPFAAAYGGPPCGQPGADPSSCVTGHGMGGAPVVPTCTTVAGNTTCAFNPVTVLVQPTPLPPSKLSVFVFEDDFPLNGEHDAGGGTGPVNTNNEAGLGGFNIILFDDAGGTGDATGQMTYDMFNQPLVNSLAGMIDPTTGFDACPISTNPRQGLVQDANGNLIPDATQTGITGTIVTCPQYEADGITPSPLAGQAVVANLMPGRYGVVATPAADRIARGEEWLQTNTLDGQKAHDSFLRVGEPSFFQEYGPAGYHVSIGFANPAIINSRLKPLCNGKDPNFPPGVVPCTNTIIGRVTTTRMSRTPDQRLYGSGDNSSFAFTQCYVSFGDPDGEDFAFTKCNPTDGTFSISGLPDGDWRVTVFDQWNDMLVDGLSTPVRLSGTGANLGDIATNQWQTNIYTTTFLDAIPYNGVPDSGEAGLTLVSTNIRFRDGSYSNFNNTDLAGNAGFNEVFPLFSWYVIETDSTRYKSMGTHVVYDAGGPTDGNCVALVTVPCGTSTNYVNMANTAEQIPVPTALRVPGARYCASADCPTGDTAGGSTGRVDPPWVLSEGWQGFSGQNEFIDFAKAPFAVGENGGIHGEVIYASTRPFDDPSLLIHTSWTPDVPGVTINLYQESTDSGPGTGNTGATTLKLVDTTKTSSWDDWAQGFRHNADGTIALDPISGAAIPNMNCPGQMRNPSTTAGGAAGDLFFYTLYNQMNYLDVYNAAHSTPVGTPNALPYNSQFKCYDGMHNWNQVQPAPYDGYYTFPSITGINPTTGAATGTNCTICVTNPDSSDPYRYGGSPTPGPWTNGVSAGTPMLPAGKYVVEMIVPPGYELVKEEDKNILIGDNYIAPVTQEFGGLGNIFIVPDQAIVSASTTAGCTVTATYLCNPQNTSQDLGRPRLPQGEGDTGSVEQFWPCVGAQRVVPDYISLFPQSLEVSPFAGATRNLCDRKEVTLEDQVSALAKFWIFTSTHVTAHYTGVITDDYTSEFDPFSPQFGEKFSPANLPVSIKDWSGAEVSRTYADQWGSYDGITYSTWEVNPPNPTGYAPTMMVTCMNDPGTGPTPDPLFNPQYSQFCYEIPFMPGQTQYMDTPVVPTTAFAGAAYNNVDCAYPDATPAILEVHSSSGMGPWVSGPGETLTITALGDQMVPNYAYSGPSATTAPFNQKYIKRHYGFGSQTGVNGTLGSVTIGGATATINSWSDSQITVTVPAGVPACPVQQQAIYRDINGPVTSPIAQCGQLVINTSAANSGGTVTGVTITRAGVYNAPPTVTFGAAPAGGTTATGTAVLGGPGGVTAVTVTAGGSGYTSAPGVSFTGGGGTGATATATGRKSISTSSIAVTSGGSYATGTPTVTFTPATGGACGPSTANGTAATVRATGTVVMATTPAPRHVASVTVTNAGSYPLGCTVTMTFAGGTPTVAATAPAVPVSGSVTGVNVTAPGSGYTSAPGVSFAGGAGTGATATATLGRQGVTSVTITNPGAGYVTAPTATFSAGVTGGTTTATGTAVINPRITTGPTQSIDTVTVTIGGKTPTHVAPTDSVQAAIDAAQPGDMLMIDPTCSTTGATQTVVACSPAGLTGATPTQRASQTAHNELLIMWKPVRLQGVGAPASVLNANTHPAGKMDVWREKVNCLFGLALNGGPISTAATGNNAGGNTYDPTGAVTCGSTNGVAWTGFKPYDQSGTTAPYNLNAQVDRLPAEAALGWNANLNGNLAELLQEPSLMGALEGAGITVLGKGVVFTEDQYQSANEFATFPASTTLLQNTLSNPTGAQCLVNGANPYPSNYMCNPSSIDGLSITNSSQGGGGIFVHAWAHNLQIGNNRIYNNAGTLAGGINLGQGEFAGANTQGGLLSAPPSCEESPVPGAVLPYCFDVNVNMHNNYISLNSSVGDELFSATPAGSGGASFCTGSDYYKFNYNWVCGNLTNGDGGGIGHIGFSYNGDIEHNTIIFNQSTNPTIPANGGGIIVMGTPDADLVCNQTNNPNGIDQDCAPAGAPGGNPDNTAVSAVSPSDGVGPGLVINGNLIMGNTAESGTGGGVAFTNVNGTDMTTFPTDPGQWNTVTFTNNIVVNNVAGWDGGAISLQDSPMVNIINNTIAYNVSTGSAGILFNTLGSPLASQGGTTTATSCTNSLGNATGVGGTTCPQPAGVVAIQHSAVLSANLAPFTVVCPPGHFQGTGAAAANNGSCKSVSYPKLENNIIYQNASFYIGVGNLGAGTLNQQHVVALYNAFTTTQPASQLTTGACVAASFWDIGVRGDTGPGNHGSTVTLNPTDSVLSSGTYTGGGTGNTVTGNPNFVHSYCNGSRVPPEFGGTGWLVPPGIADATVPNPIFSLRPAATVDEGNNWVNMSYGPLSLTNSTVIAGANGNYGGGAPLGNYSITTGSAAGGRVAGPPNRGDAPRYDFFNRPRNGGTTDAGAVLLTGTAGAQFTMSPALVDFGLIPVHSPTTVDQDILVTNSDIVPITIPDNGAISCAGVTTCSAASFTIQPNAPATAPGEPYSNCAGTTLAAGESCMINVVFNPTSTSQAARNANLVLTVNGVSQTVALTGHDTIATISVTPLTPALTTTPASTVAHTSTITITNTANLCLATPCPGGSSIDAGPWIPTNIALSSPTGTGTFALGGTCAVGTPVNPGVVGTTPATPGGSCTITITYTPPAGATGAALNGSVHLTVAGIGRASTALVVNATYNAN